MARLSPEDLCALAQTCRYFRFAASDPGIWRALYYARWPSGPTEADPLAEGRQYLNGWKLMYLQRDGTEVAAEAGRAPTEEAREIFAQMAAARRSEPLSSTAASVLGPVLGTALAERVAAFRRERGIASSNASDLASSSAAGTSAAGARSSPCNCPGGCTFVELQQNFWICERGGHVHACGDACTEREVDKTGDMLVCSITGRCFPRLMSEWEEAGGRGGGGDDDGARDGEDPGGGDWNAAEGTEGMGGRLGRAFFAGYHAADEREMLMRFGIRM